MQVSKVWAFELPFLQFLGLRAAVCNEPIPHIVLLHPIECLRGGVGLIIVFPVRERCRLTALSRPPPSRAFLVGTVKSTRVVARPISLCHQLCLRAVCSTIARLPRLALPGKSTCDAISPRFAHFKIALARCHGCLSEGGTTRKMKLAPVPSCSERNDCTVSGRMAVEGVRM